MVPEGHLRNARRYMGALAEDTQGTVRGPGAYKSGMQDGSGVVVYGNASRPSDTKYLTSPDLPIWNSVVVRLDRAASWTGMFPWAGGFLRSALADPVEGLAHIHLAAWPPANLAMTKSPAFPLYPRPTHVADLSPSFPSPFIYPLRLAIYKLPVGNPCLQQPITYS